MAVIWQNTFDGPDGTSVTVANSADYGDALFSAVRSYYTHAWSASGAGCVTLTETDNRSGEVEVTVPSSVATIGGRAYLYIPPLGWANGGGLDDAAFGNAAGWKLSAQDITSLEPELRGKPFRAEWIRPLIGPGQVQWRLFWGSNLHGTVPDYEVTAASRRTTLDETVWVGGPGMYLDELVLTDGEWPGPLQSASARITLSLTGDLTGVDPPPLPPAAGPPVESLMIGPLGDLREVAERAPVSRTPDLGAAEFTSLEGRVTVSRTRAPARRVEWAWDRLLPRDRDWLAEVAFLSRTLDSTVCVIDPAARNLAGVEQSRGAPVAGTTSTAPYRWEGSGTLTTATVDGRSRAVIENPAPDGVLTWVHPYYWERGWPVMPGWPVYLRAEDMPGVRVELWFHDPDGSTLAIASGTGEVSADAPSGAVTVSPRAVATTPTDRLVVGGIVLSYAPQAGFPLGDGCPVYAVTGWSEEPDSPWYSVKVGVVEVTSGAVR